MRYALYYTPAPATTFWRIGSSILGYDSQSGRDVPLATEALFADDDFRKAQSIPRIYGLHATLKAPFALVNGKSEQSLVDHLHAFCKTRPECPIGTLEVTMLGQFAALQPADDAADVNDLAAACVREFDEWRAPLTSIDRSRRLAPGLTPRQVLALETWGYPYVLGEFRFHMTLTGPLLERLRDVALDAFRRVFDGHLSGHTLDSISLAVQPSPNERFKVIHRVPLTGRQTA